MRFCLVGFFIGLEVSLRAHGHMECDVAQEENTDYVDRVATIAGGLMRDLKTAPKTLVCCNLCCAAFVRRGSPCYREPVFVCQGCGDYDTSRV